MEQITLSDTIAEFIRKCNKNFGEIQNYGGPQGRPGENGRPGATGARGTGIRYVTVADDGDSDFPIEEANAAVHDLDLDAGDVVIFSNGYFGNIVLDDEGSDFVPVVDGISDALIGPPGPKGDTGSAASDQFGVENNMLKLMDGFSGLSVSRGGSEPTNLYVDNVHFKYGGNYVCSITPSATELKLVSSNTVSLLSANMVVGNGSGDVKINGNSVSMSSGTSNVNIDSSGLSVSGNSSFNGNTDFRGNIFFNSGNTQTSISGGLITNDEIKTKKIVVDLGNQDNFTVDSTELNFKNRFTIQGNVVSTSMRIDSESSIRVKNGGNEYITLDSPRYVTTLWPDGTTPPDNWIALNRNIYITNVEVVSSQNQNVPENDGKLYFIFNGTKYCIENVYNQLFDTVLIPVSNGGSSSTNTDINVVVNPGTAEFFEDYYAVPVNDNNSLSVNIGNVTFTDREVLSPNSYYSDSSNVVTQTSMAFAEYSAINIAENTLPETNISFNIGSIYGNFMKNFLKLNTSGGQPALKDMSLLFTEITTNATTNKHLFVFPRPQAPAGFVWIFKNA